MTSRPCKPRRHQARAGDAQEPRGHAVLRASICVAPNSPIRASASPSTMPLISNGPMRTCSMASTSAPPATSPIPSSRSPACPAPASWRSSSRCASELPPEVFTTPYANPVNGNAQQRRQNLLKAAQPLGRGRLEGGRRSAFCATRPASPCRSSSCSSSPTFERIVLPYVEQLKLLGMRSGVRTIDSAQYERRMQSFDFDIAVVSWPSRCRRATSSANFWSSEAADRQGSRTMPASRIPSSTSSSTASSSPRAARSSSMPAGRSTGSCCGTSMSCRCGIFLMSGWHSGTASAVPIPCRPMPWHFRPSGGGTQTRPQQSGGKT